MKIGVLALQGDVVEHRRILESLGVSVVEVRTPAELELVVGLILPGGESTTLMKLLKRIGLDKAIRKRVRSGMPVFGTCAGAILVAKEVVGNNQPTMKLMDIAIKRNDYGRQIDSFEAEMKFKGKKIKGAFIRAPVIESVGKNVEELIVYKGEVVACRQKNVLVATFHPELCGDATLHKLFLSM